MVFTATLHLLSPLALAQDVTDQPASDTTTNREVEPEQAEARERETGAEQDPLAQRQANKVDTPIEHKNEPDKLTAYASLQVRYRRTGDENRVDDGGSRIGGNGQWQYRPDYWLSGRVEIGFNVLDQLDAIFHPGSNSSTGDDEVFLRLLYANLETPRFFAVIGKAWSTYYTVAGFTDRFEGTGGSASGAFNAGTDGGPSGTGRADNVLQTRVLIDPSRLLARRMKPFTLNLQLQNKQEIPLQANIDNGMGNLRYGLAFGLSALLQTRDDFNLGIAYNHAGINDEDLPALQRTGIDGNDRAFLVGAKWFSEGGYLATTLSWTWNHMTTDEYIFFDGRGWELYGHYNLHNRFWAVAGLNILKPNDNQPQAGNYQVKYGVLGLRYSFKQFNRMAYANVRFDSSTPADASRSGLTNTYTIGIHWDIP